MHEFKDWQKTMDKMQTEWTYAKGFVVLIALPLAIYMMWRIIETDKLATRLEQRIQSIEQKK
jgi:hypothetical protein